MHNTVWSALVIDAIRMKSWKEELYRLSRFGEMIRLYDTTRYAMLKEQSPLLVPCQEGSELWQRWQNDRYWQSSAIAIQWNGDTGIGAIADHLRSVLRVNREGRSPVLFRFYSPRLINAWGSSLTTEEKDAFMGPLTRLHTLQGEGRGQARKAADAPWFTLSEKQIQAIDRLIKQSLR